ncbi:MAG TPA: hypothetical protein VM754_08250 [Actinomycetota bacterium]|nr:hypothetical protein [Actinomycetota bacterium]
MRRIRYAGTFLLFLLAFAGTIQPARAQTNQASPVNIIVNAGYEQRYLPGKSVPVSIILESTRAVAGDLEVFSLAPDGSSLVRAVPMEIPAGGRKQFDLVVPAAGLPTSRLQVSVVESGETLASARVELINTGRQLLVGILDEQIPGGIAGVRLEPTGHELRPAVVPPEWLSLGGKALQPLSYLILDADRARGLPEADLQAVFDWTVSGGRLVVTTRDPSSLDWLPQGWQSEWSQTGEGWQPAGTGSGRTIAGGAVSSPAGLGLVAVVPNAGPSDLAPVLAGLTPAPSSAGGFSDMFGAPSVDFELLGALSANAGGAIRLGWLVGFLVLYVLIAGPLNYLLLRRKGRKELAWITVPVLALLFSGVAYGLARGARGGLSVEQANVVFATAEGHASQRVITVSSGSGGRQRVDFETRDAIEPWGMGGFDGFGGATVARRRKVVRLTGTGSQAILQTSPFSAGIAQGSLDESPGYLDSALTWDGSGFAGTVTNRTQMKLDVVLISPGRRDLAVGELEPGASQEVNLEASRMGPAPNRFDPFMVQPGGPTDESLRRALTGTAFSMLGAEHSFGAPLLVGFTKEFAPALTVNGSRRTPKGPAIVASPVNVTVPSGTGGTLPAMAGRVDIVSVDGSAFLRGQALQLGDFREVVFAYRLPAGVPSNQVADATFNSSFQGMGHRLETFDWGLGQWVEAENRGPGERVLPGSSFTEAGEAYLRISPQNEPYIELWGLDVQVNLK